MLAEAFPPAFSTTEYERRLSAVRELMEAEGLTLLLLFAPENVTYLTGYETIGYSSFLCLLVPLDGEPELVLREMELDVAEATTWLSDFTTVGDSDDQLAVTASVVGRLDSGAGRIGVEETSAFLTARTWRALVALLDPARTASGSGLVEHVRRVKSAEELAHVREASTIVSRAMQVAIAAVADGVSENVVAARAFTAMVERGSDFLAADPIVTSGPRGSVAHTTFGGRTIRSGESVLIELGACRRRYFGALMRTVGVGGGTARFAELADVLDEALDAAITTIAPGVSCGEVDAACRSRIEAGGLGAAFRKRTGYSMGVAFAPDWGEGHIVSLREGDATLLEPGMVFHIPPAVRLPGTDVYGVSETVVVTESGCDVLTALPRRFTA